MLHVRLATEGDIPGIVVVSAAAFDPRTDAATAQLFPARLQPDGDPSAAIHSVLTARKSRILAGKGQTLIVATDAGEIAGYAIWTPPTGGDKQERTGDQPVPDGMDAEAVAAMRQGFADDERAALGENGTQSTWRLLSLGVHPLHQRRGIGRMLLEWGTVQATSRRQDCYLLATPAGAPLYRSAGFKEREITVILGVPHVSMVKRHE